MELRAITYAYHWLDRQSGIVFSMILGCFMLSCPTVDKTGANSVDSADDIQLTAKGGSSGTEDDDAAGADVGPNGVKQDSRVGIEVPVLGDDPLKQFYTALSELDEQKRDKVRVLHYGDSHTAADFLTTAVRRGLQTRFGDGGRGFVLLGKPWRSYRPKDIEVQATGDWQPERILIAADPVTLDGYYGLAGITTETSDKFARSIVRTVPDSQFGRVVSLLDVFYMVQPGGGSMQVFVDGRPKGTVTTAGERKRSGFYKVKVAEGAHEFEVRTNGDGEIRLFGAAVESDRGLVYDALGVNGGFFYTPHRWNEAELQKQIERRDPQLIVTMYGTNETGSKTITPTSYKDKVQTTMNRFMEGAPDASCLMIGPPDRVAENGTADRLAWIIQVQREVAAEMGCGFIDLQEMMGGAGSHEAWQQTSPPMSQTDGIHLTVRGYMYLGEQIAAELIAAYEGYQK
ncbi:MAG: hypothetical protein JXX29_14570 [Deltaproteobacteria bacterium]|nr:hypothetical protein [Deltaproteobacteria bacterium]MBN2672904.1 hypothetical protein [Deltaproteobacteria bacterium]